MHSITPRNLFAACAMFFASSFYASAAESSLWPQAAASGQVTPTAAPWPADQAGLNALAKSSIENMFAKIVAKDWAAFQGLLLPGYQRINYLGACDRGTELEACKKLERFGVKISEVVATRVGDALVSTCLVQTNGLAELTPRIGVWQWVDGGWKLAAWGWLGSPSPRPAPVAPGFAGDEKLNAEGGAMVLRFLNAQHKKDLKAFDGMIAEGMQVVNFKGAKVRADMIRGAKAATTDAPTVTDVRTTRCGDLTVVTCNLSMGQKIVFETLPADPAPFLVVFQGTGDAAKVIAIANTNKTK